MEAKYCAGCDKHVPLRDWTKHNSTADRLQHQCKHCRNARRREARRSKKGFYATEQEKYKEKHLVAARRSYYKCKHLVMRHYCGGENYTCCQCGFADPRALSIDHVDGKGADHRRNLKGVNLYRWLVREKYPDGFQVLCMNCQWIKRHEECGFEEV